MHRPYIKTDHVVVIGSSTGGPRALNTLIPALPTNLDMVLLIVQHMPEGFTRSLAERLDQASPFAIKEAENGDLLEVGRGYLAPGGFHMGLDSNQRIALNKNPALHGVRPAVDVTLAAAAQHFGSQTISVILTGMGHDGANGSLLIHESGGHVIAEDESTCVVWGMPRSVVEIGAADMILPLDKIANALSQRIRTPSVAGVSDPHKDAHGPR